MITIRNECLLRLLGFEPLWPGRGLAFAGMSAKAWLGVAWRQLCPGVR